MALPRSEASNAPSRKACDPLKLALRVASASDTLARWHRDMMSRNSAEADSTSQLSPRELQILHISERLAIAAESIAESQREAVSNKSEGTAVANHRDSDKMSAPSAMKVASLVAKEARRSYDRQMACSAVPQAWEVEVTSPEWAQQQLKKQLLSSRGQNEDQVQLLSNTYSLCLTCPLSGNLLNVPVRGTCCRHIECFDLESFRHSAPIDWRCPMVGCAAYATPETLRRDSFLEALLRQVDPSQTSIALNFDLIGFKFSGSVAQRAHALAVQARSSSSSPSLLQSRRMKATSPIVSTPIEIIDSDTELPAPKRGKKQRSPLGGG